VLAYGINSACVVASVYSHRDAVTGLDLLPRSSSPLGSTSRTAEPTSALWLEHSTHIMVSGSWDATVKVWSVTVANGETVSINREPLGELFDAESSIVCVSVESVPGGGIVIGAGCADGSFCVWNLHNDGGKDRTPPVSLMSCTSCGRHETDEYRLLFRT
jgi:WD40 repeat protein